MNVPCGLKPQSFPLMNLSGELRNQIYRELFANITTPDESVTVWDDGWSEQQQIEDYLRLILTCKQIKYEAQSIFEAEYLDHIIWRFKTLDDFDDFLHVCHGTRLEDNVIRFDVRDVWPPEDAYIFEGSNRAIYLSERDDVMRDAFMDLFDSLWTAGHDDTEALEAMTEWFIEKVDVWKSKDGSPEGFATRLGKPNGWKLAVRAKQTILNGRPDVCILNSLTGLQIPFGWTRSDPENARWML